MSDHDISSCPICGEQLPENVLEPEMHDGTYQLKFNCSVCGKFAMPGRIYNFIEGISVANENNFTYNKAALKSSLFYYLRVIRKHPQNNSFVYFTLDKVKYDNALGIYYEKIDALYDLYPNRIDLRIKKVMQILHRDIAKLGDRCYSLDVGMSHRKKALRYVMADDDLTTRQVDATWKYLYDKHYVEGQQSEFTFTSDGWDELIEIPIAPIQVLPKNPLFSANTSDSSKTVFIAMDFKHKNESTEMGECRAAIKEAIEKSNYEPIIIDEIEHNNYIPKEIFNKIESAKFMVADLTFQNCGVYYEAGIAKGLGKDVIFTCNSWDFKNIHFDTKQINTIKWKTKDDLLEKLYNRIIETIE